MGDRFAHQMLVLASVLSLTGSVSMAQTKPVSGNSGKKVDSPKQSQPGDLLAGPKVDDDAQKLDGPMMGPQGQERSRRPQPVNFEQWYSALRGLDLSQEQQDKVRSISEEFHQAMREFREAHAREAGELESQAREAIQAGKQPPQEVRQKREKLEADRPKPEDFQKRMWNELTDDQQTALKAKLDQLIAQMRKQQAEQRQKRLSAEVTKAGESTDNTNERPPRRGDSTRPVPVQTSDKPKTDEMMGPSTDEKSDPKPAAGAQFRGRATERRGGAAGVDEIGERRLRFLRARQAPAASAPNHPSGEPTEAERKFKFDDEDQGNDQKKP